MLARRAAALGLVALAACGSSATKADQVRSIASSAGLPAEVADFVQLSTKAGDGTFTVTYTSTATDGSTQQVTVSQRPPDRRVDVYGADGGIESTIVTGGQRYQCSKHEQWTCGAISLASAPDAGGSGVLDSSTVTAAVQQLTQRVGDYDFHVESRTIAGTSATCLVSTLKPGHDDPSKGASGTLCLAPTGAQLLVDVPSGKLEASAYGTEIPDGTFSLPADPSSASSSSASSGG